MGKHVSHQSHNCFTDQSGRPADLKEMLAGLWWNPPNCSLKVRTLQHLCTWKVNKQFIWVWKESRENKMIRKYKQSVMGSYLAFWCRSHGALQCSHEFTRQGEPRGCLHTRVLIQDHGPSFGKGPILQLLNRCFSPLTISFPHGLATFVAELSQSINSGHISSNGKVSRDTFFSLVNFIVSFCCWDGNNV